MVRARADALEQAYEQQKRDALAAQIAKFQNPEDPDAPSTCKSYEAAEALIIKAMKKGDSWLADRVYSGVPAGDFGLQQVIRIGHMSGRSNVLHWLERNGYDADDGLVAHMFEIAKSQRRMMTDDEVHSAIAEYRGSNS